MTSDDLLKAVNQLSVLELARFVSQVIVLQAQRRSIALPETESDLLLRINRGIPLEVRQQYDGLITKRQEETLTPDEHDELIAFTEQIENLEAQRIESLAELARLRGLSLSAVMQDLSIGTSELSKGV